jgi:putative endonuclease
VREDTRPTVGRRGEQLAAEHLVRRGFEIVERNYRTRWGELDIVAFDGRTIAFCEVKARRVAAGAGSGAGDRRVGASAVRPFDSLHPRKRQQVRKMAMQWLADRPDRPFAASLRFDAIGVVVDADGGLVELEHLEGAF